MNHPNRPQQPAISPGVPPPPPKINSRRLWITLLTPSIVMVFIMVGLFFVVSAGGGLSEDLFFTVSCTILCIAFAIAWGFFIHTLHQRFRGPSFALLILAYPVLQAVLIFGIFFGGCLAIIAIDGY